MRFMLGIGIADPRRAESFTGCRHVFLISYAGGQFAHFRAIHSFIDVWLKETFELNGGAQAPKVLRCAGSHRVLRRPTGRRCSVVHASDLSTRAPRAKACAWLPSTARRCAAASTSSPTPGRPTWSAPSPPIAPWMLYLLPSRDRRQVQRDPSLKRPAPALRNRWKWCLGTPLNFQKCRFAWFQKFSMPLMWLSRSANSFE